MPWRTIEGEDLAPATMPQLQVVVHGLLEKQHLLDFIRHFIVFEDQGGGVLTKKIAGYRLDRPGKCPREPASSGEAHPQKIRLAHLPPHVLYPH